MNHLGLFDGIGGFSLAARWMGWKTLAWCEWNEFGQKVLKYHFPDAEGFGDITKTDFTKYANRIDIITGGFPCQPYSVVGKRLGKEDDRHLWPEMLRAIREVKPTWVVGENVFGLINWNGGRRKIQKIRGENFKRSNCNGIYGFASHPYGATERYNFGANKESSRKIWRQNKSFVFRKFCSTWNVTYANGCIGCKRGMHSIRCKEAKRYISTFDTRKIGDWQNFPTQSPICSGNDGFSDKLDGITFSKWRNESIKAMGNAIVPQVAFEIFKTIDKYESLKQ